MLFSANAIDFAYQEGTGLDNISPGMGGVVLVADISIRSQGYNMA